MNVYPSLQQVMSPDVLIPLDIKLEESSNYQSSQKSIRDKIEYFKDFDKLHNDYSEEYRFIFYQDFVI